MFAFSRCRFGANFFQRRFLLTHETAGKPSFSSILLSRADLSIPQSDIIAAFGSFGEIRSCDIVQEHHGRLATYLVTFAKPEDTTQARQHYRKSRPYGFGVEARISYGVKTLQKQPRRTSPKSDTLFVSGFPFPSDRAFRAEFEKYGEIKSATLRTETPRNFGRITFNDPEAASRILQSHPEYWMRNQHGEKVELKLDFATQKDKVTDRLVINFKASPLTGPLQKEVSDILRAIGMYQHLGEIVCVVPGKPPVGDNKVVLRFQTAYGARRALIELNQLKKTHTGISFWASLSQPSKQFKNVQIETLSENDAKHTERLHFLFRYYGRNTSPPAMVSAYIREALANDSGFIDVHAFDYIQVTNGGEVIGHIDFIDVEHAETAFDKLKPSLEKIAIGSVKLSFAHPSDWEPFEGYRPLPHP
ncbi:hypothetical protein C8J56DRAFT_346669 [Mycena floridula]|nr:hypothetical protein C8J56DRAFT_346669 [Mycena floridula]